jgi:hypothetical protein
MSWDARRLQPGCVTVAATAVGLACAAAFAIRGAEVLPSPLPLGDGFGIGSLEQKIKFK